MKENFSEFFGVGVGVIQKKKFGVGVESESIFFFGVGVGVDQNFIDSENCYTLFLCNMFFS